MKPFIALLSLIFTTAVLSKTTPNYAKEKTWGVQIVDSLMDGDAVWLSANNHQFLSLLTASEKPSKKATIILHGLGGHPDMQQVIQPLRVALTSKGYHTMSVQMPVLSNGVDPQKYTELLNDSDARIKVVISHLETKGLVVDLLIAHSMGSVMATHFMANNNHPFKKFVGVGMPEFVIDFLPKITITTLDLYGTEDIETVLTSVKARAVAAKNNKKYQQKVVKTDHFFEAKDELLIKTVSEWIRQN